MTVDDGASHGRSINFATWMRVSDVLQSYADAIDRGDIAGILSLFTLDAIWEYSPGVTRQGHGEIDLFFQKRMRVWRGTSHNVCAPVVRRIPKSDGIESTVYFTAKHILQDGTSYAGWGRYVDRFTEHGGALLIAHRAVVAHVTEGTSRAYNMLQRSPGPFDNP